MGVHVPGSPMRCAHTIESCSLLFASRVIGRAMGLPVVRENEDRLHTVQYVLNVNLLQPTVHTTYSTVQNKPLVIPKHRSMYNMYSSYSGTVGTVLHKSRYSMYLLYQTRFEFQ